MQDLKIVSFPLYAFSKCKYGSAIFIIKVLRNQKFEVDWNKVSDILLESSYYLRFSNLSTFTAYTISQVTSIKKIILNVENSISSNVKDVSNYYRNYQITFEEYLLLFNIFSMLIHNAIEKSNFKEKSNSSVFIDISEISNLYLTKSINIKDKLEHFKETFKAFFCYNEFIFMEYEIVIHESISKLEIKFKDYFSTDVNIQII